MVGFKQVLSLLGISALGLGISTQNSSVDWPIHDNGLTDLVKWFNAFSIYNHWGYHNPLPGVLDFESGAHNFTKIMTLAKDLGMYMIIRPGPYINAEANAGGFPLWVTTGAYGGLRDNDPRYTEAWKPYMTEISKIIAPHLITNGGNVILFQVENELGNQWLNVATKTPNLPVQEYMELLEKNARENGINVPLTHNAPNMPNFMPEFQGGSYNPWGGPQGGCPGDIGADFANLFYRNLIYQRVSAISLYMLFGGTSWGWHAAPVVVAPDLAMTDRVGNDTDYSTNSAIAVSELRNPETGARFYVVMHSYSPSGTLETLHLRVKTTEGQLTIPQHGGSIAINGHQAKILVTDFQFGSKKLLYSTAEVLTYAAIDGREILALWVPTGESGEFTVLGVKSAKVKSCEGCANVKFFAGKSRITISFTHNAGMSVIEFDDGSRVVLLDRSAAYLFWAPSLTNNPVHSPNSTILVQGPYLVRSSSIQGHILELTGDVANKTTIRVFAPKSIRNLRWNGESVRINSSANGFLTAQIKGAPSYTLPALSGWKYADSLPEIRSDYDASGVAWKTANHTKTSNPTTPASNNPVLYVDDYGVHAGSHLYRATFPTTQKPPTGVFLDITGGLAFGYSVWLNSHFVGSWLGLSYVDKQGLELSFKNVTLNSGEKDNVLVVLMDNSGHDQRQEALNPRGITNATLLGPGGTYSFTEWKIAGAARKEDAVLDPVRGFLNEGGLYAERVGMHLPGYPDADWNVVETGNSLLSVQGAGVRICRTQVPLDIPSGVDVSISFRLTTPSEVTFTSETGKTNQLRALLFVNGYQYGRFNPHIGNQIDYPVPPGILNYNGDNDIAITLWSQSAEGAEMKVEWNVDYVHRTSYDMRFDASYLRPGWNSLDTTLSTTQNYDYALQQAQLFIMYPPIAYMSYGITDVTVTNSPTMPRFMGFFDCFLIKRFLTDNNARVQNEQNTAPRVGYVSEPPPATGIREQVSNTQSQKSSSNEVLERPDRENHSRANASSEMSWSDHSQTERRNGIGCQRHSV
ncbi:hypothetical protein FHL15_009406 [Xylaria flabelliformis]|uniref:beta-galactosidase n=1 Tax=Xylaria flabelliformis TaxID=2512241 RepID=A0A553HNX7_9PEZI|nr:hypothetical protein FHL15_009406 [Xylaria flabelliformis]